MFIVVIKNYFEYYKENFRGNPMNKDTMTSEELLKAAFREAARQELEELENAADISDLPPTDKQKRELNRHCRKLFGMKALPFPEVDTACERIRSRIARTGSVLTRINKKNQA